MAEELDYAGSTGLDVLDVGCGQGIDVARYAQAGATATGVDLTPRHVELARAHLAALGLDATIELGDAESAALRRRELRSRLEQRRPPPHPGHAGGAARRSLASSGPAARRGSSSTTSAPSTTG